MPHNLIKVYNELLEFDQYNENQRTKSLRSIFKRDIIENPDFSFKNKTINPVVKNGMENMEVLFDHLTKEKDKNTSGRYFERERSRRIHWIRHHIEERKKNNMLVFSCKDPNGIRTYIFDKDENYVIILEPFRNKNEYYLITAYYLRGRNPDKIEKKFKRKLDELY